MARAAAARAAAAQAVLAEVGALVVVPKVAEVACEVATTAVEALVVAAPGVGVWVVGRLAVQLGVAVTAGAARAARAVGPKAVAADAQAVAAMVEDLVVPTAAAGDTADCRMAARVDTRAAAVQEVARVAAVMAAPLVGQRAAAA